MPKQRIKFLGDTLGLAPFPLRLKQAMIVLFGEEDVPRLNKKKTSYKRTNYE